MKYTKCGYMTCKRFAIFCSGNATVVRKVFKCVQNNKFKPQLVIYQGTNNDIREELAYTFSDIQFIILRDEILTNTQKSCIHTTTSQFIFDALKEFNIDFLINFGNKIFKQNFIKDYKERIINFHPSLLPSFKGLNAFDQSYEHNVCIDGNTVHFVEEEIDSGKIILQAATLMSNKNTTYEYVIKLQIPMLKMVLRDVIGLHVLDEEIFEGLILNQPFLIPQRCNIFTA